MKIYKAALCLAASVLIASCAVPEAPEFVAGHDIEVGPAGGIEKFSVSSPDNWVAICQEPWITVSPANGKGSAECKVMVDSSLLFETREGKVFIENVNTKERQEFVVSQKGFDYSISLEDKEISLAQFAPIDNRKFNVVVNSNIDFDVVIPADAENWLSYTKSPLVLDRGARPRGTNIKFEWKVNSKPEKRMADISFKPKKSVELAKNDVLKVVQGAAQKIEPGTVEGDSLALLAISRGLGVWAEYKTAERMSLWDNVEVWKEGPNKGRVKYVQFSFFTCKEGIPYEIRYLTAADEISIYGNTNAFLRSLDTGESIGELTNLRKLTIGGYGLTTLNPAMTKLKNLEYLNLTGNNFQTVPDILCQENFPSLTALVLNGNQRSFVPDMSNGSGAQLGGFADEKTFPIKLLEWSNLDTLRLSVNYFSGELPDMASHEKWTAEEVHACDTLPEILIGLPKVLPNADMFTLNLNRMSGKLPDWLLYHPKLDLWMPFSLVFEQEGRDAEGRKAGFSNEPVNLDYYYAEYTNKKYNPDNKE